MTKDADAGPGELAVNSTESTAAELGQAHMAVHERMQGWTTPWLAQRSHLDRRPHSLFAALIRRRGAAGSA